MKLNLLDVFNIFKKGKDIDKDDIINNIDDTKKVLEEVAIKLYAEYISIVGKNNEEVFKDNKARDIFSLFSFYAKLKTKNLTEEVNYVLQMLLNMKNVLNKLIDYINEDFSDKLNVTVITYPQANYLGVVYAANFTVDYSINLLNYLITSYNENNDETEITNTISKEKIKKLKEGVEKFANCYLVMVNKPEDIKKNISKIPDNIISDKTNAIILNTYDEKVLDPFRMSYIYNANPFHWIAMQMVEYRAKKYAKAKEEKNVLELKLLKLRNKMNENPDDIKLQKNIEHTQSRVDKLNSRITDIESEVYGN